MALRLDSLYLCVEDMDRALGFYEALLGIPPAVRDKIYSVFEIGGFRLGLFAYREKGEPHTFGTNCLPSLRTESLSALQALLAGRETPFPLTRIGPNWVAEILDTEGNRLELTAPAGGKPTGQKG